MQLRLAWKQASPADADSAGKRGKFFRKVRPDAPTLAFYLVCISCCEEQRKSVENHIHPETWIMADAIAEKRGAASDELLQLVSFNIGGEEFGVDILQVQEIIRMLEVTRVPNAPEYVDGVINLRGKVIPIIDLRRRFEMQRKDHDKNTRIVVVELSGQVVGFVVDAVSEVLRIPWSVTEPPPSIVGGVRKEYITAVGKLEDRLLILLDLEKVLKAEEKDEVVTIAKKSA
jgi:purine-binding chemotaxis protein CheW